MKKILSIITLISISLINILTSNVNAVELNTFSANVNNNIVVPGDNVIVNAQFGQDMGKYTLEVAYDNNLFEYVSVIGGIGEDKGNSVEVKFHDEVGNAPSSFAVVLFQAKGDIITEVPTDFSTTVTNMENADFTQVYDSILLPVVNEVIIQPIFTDYIIDLEYEGQIIAEEEKAMTLNISSILGKNYDQTRIIAEVKTETEGTVKLLGKDYNGEDFDLVQNGYGDPSGDQIGGEDILKQLQLTGIFSKEGAYSIDIKLIDRENEDDVIAEKTLELNVYASEAVEAIEDEEVEIIEEIEEEEEIPTEIPDAGNTSYVAIVTSLSLLFSIYAVLKSRNVVVNSAYRHEDEDED